MMILDLLATNDWERPIYWAITVGRDKYLNLQDYFQVEGFAYRFVPIKTTSSPQQLQFGRVETDLMYDNLMNKFKWGNMNNPDVYIDENNMRMMTNIRNSFNRLASALIDEGKKEKAIEVLDRCFDLVPIDLVAPEYFTMELADSYYKAGASQKGKAIMEQAFEVFNDELGYYFSLDLRFIQTKSVNEEIQRGLFYLQRMERAARTGGDDEFAKKINDAFQDHLAKFGVS
jgi:tetratricopeptide (TPR) repeat protein